MISKLSHITIFQISASVRKLSVLVLEDEYNDTYVGVGRWGLDRYIDQYKRFEYPGIGSEGPLNEETRKILSDAGKIWGENTYGMTGFNNDGKST